ncbi:PD-(D/E)XK motif protein [Kitasatospora purpeofusca]|uniref:PD-(D/E)XK motif protein n=1 Tax=Kitasatospora purpeofusca TaxID=67352 RepID=UPI002A5ABCED|nr:PD-(D/E)XK motif protein [Kitasatospora purpeofusca]MDY0811001.1 PD-(D/E)XK motif protein [Kitasatospora purpeofusca]
MSTTSDVSAQLRETLELLWTRLDDESRSGPPALMLSAELKITTRHGLVRLGRDADGMRHLLVPISPTQRLDDDRRSGGVHLTSRVLLVDDMPVRFADLLCRRRDLSGVFTGLVADVCARVAAEPEGSPFRIAQTLNSWRLLFGGQTGRWTIPRLAGLFAELVVLESLLDERSDALGAWQGPTGCAQDFRSTHHAIEVKASTAAGGRIVRIHGVDQLEAPEGGTLYLAWFRVAVSTGQAARSILDLVECCRAKADAVDLLDARLATLGITGEANAVVADTRFESTDERWYEVGDAFPRVIPASFTHGAVPAGVGGMEYLVDLDNVPARADRIVALNRLASDL